MSRGGRRPGSGRKPGHLNEKNRAIASEAAKNGLTPLEFALQVMQSEAESPARRDFMCQLAMPYLHARVSSLPPKQEQPAPTSFSINLICPPNGSHVDLDGNLVVPPASIDADDVIDVEANSSSLDQ